MADEINPTAASETIAAVDAASAKKQRVPRAKKAAADASATPAVKGQRGGRRKRAEAAEATATAASAPAKGPRGGKRAAAESNVTGKSGAKRGPQANLASAPFTDDLADLLKLEEENQQLRKELAEKLRAENADLKKRLGR